mmetsp:Transcript_11253/g.33790  ORF Transcript_11253/g.33790 Transcript_11253/m.33790 type:complete len:253 (+) Transcript_11253:1177-1935(+)
MSTRTIIFSSSKSRAASALHSSVFPTPVGPRKRKEEPLWLAARPARLRSTASATMSTARFWPTTRLCSASRSDSSFSRSVCCSRVTGMPVQRATTLAISSGDTISDRRPSGLRARWAALMVASTSGRLPYLISAAMARSLRTSAISSLLSSSSRLLRRRRSSSRRSRSCSYRLSAGRRVSSRLLTSLFTSASRPTDALSFSLDSAVCSTFRAVRRRCMMSMSSGTESSCTRMLEHASSTRSIALSGRKRSVM